MHTLSNSFYKEFAFCRTLPSKKIQKKNPVAFHTLRSFLVFVYGDFGWCEDSTSSRHNFHVTDYQMDLCVIQPGYVPLLHPIFWKGEGIGFAKPLLSAYIYPQMRRPFTVMATRRSFLFFGHARCLELFWFTIMLRREVYFYPFSLHW